MKFARFTNLLGQDVWVSPAYVMMVAPPTAGMYPNLKSKTVIFLSGREQAVREEPLDVVRDLESVL